MPRLLGRVQRIASIPIEASSTSPPMSSTTTIPEAKPTRFTVVPAAMITVALADDQVLVRDGFRLILDVEADIEVVAEASDGAEAISQVAAHPSRRAAHGHPDARAGRNHRHPKAR
jgi:hypothetical protein